MRSCCLPVAHDPQTGLLCICNWVDEPEALKHEQKHLVCTGVSMCQSIEDDVSRQYSAIPACRCLLPQWPCPSTWACRPAYPRTALVSWSTACFCPSSMKPSSCSWRSALEGSPLQHCASCCPHGLHVTCKLSRNCLSWCSGHV